MSADPNRLAKPGAAQPATPARPMTDEKPGAAAPDPAATPPPAPADQGPGQQRAADAPVTPEPVTLDNPDDYTFQDGDQPLPDGTPGVPMAQWNPEITGESADYVPDEGDQPIQYGTPNDPAEAGKDQIRQSLLDRRGGVG